MPFHLKPTAAIPDLSKQPANENDRAHVTSFDVARRAGVSRASVSRAFTPGGNISPELRDHVRKVADELGYRVNQMARGLNRQRTDLVGLIVSRLDNPYRTAQVEALSKRLVEQGFRPILFCVDSGASVERELQLLLEYQVCGVVITSDAPPARICEECSRMGVPLILVNRNDDVPNVDHVFGDNQIGGQLAADTLVDAGRTALIALKPIRTSYSLQRRLEVFQEHALKRGHDVILVEMPGSDYAAGLSGARGIAQSIEAHKLTAGTIGVFCPNDIAALGCLDGLRLRERFQVPEDIALIGFDDIPQSGWESAQLTTIKQPTDIFADAVLNLLQSRLAEPERPQRRICIPVELVRRHTA